MAAERWPRDGLPQHPVAWLVVTGRNRAIDHVRRERPSAFDSGRRPLRRLGRREQARAAFEHVLRPAATDPERRFLACRLAEL